MDRTLTLALIASFVLSGCMVAEGQEQAEERPATGDIDEPLEAGDLTMADGFSVRSLADGLEFPVAIDWDDDGNIYLGMAGFAYGMEGFDPPKVVRLSPDGETETVATGFEPPLIDITWHDGALYVSARGNITRVDVATGEREVVIDGLPAYGDHHNNEVTFGPDGRLFVPVGIATNAHVVGIENTLPGFGWSQNVTGFSDIPCQDITLAGINHVTENPFRVPESPINMSAVVVEYASEDDIPDHAWGVEGENVTTGAYVPFGTPTYRGQEIKGAVPCTGSLLVAEADGSGLDWYAWGFRNPYGIKFDDEGRLWLSQNGADVRGSRPVHSSPDRLWQVEEGAWYGYSEFEGGVPINDTRFAPPGEDPLPRLLTANPGNATPGLPALNFSVHAAATKFDLAPDAPWGDRRTVYMAFYGDNVPATGPPGEHSGHSVVRFHLDALDPREITPIMHGETEIDRRFRPVEAAFGPDGDLYVVNIGVVAIEQLPIGPDADPKRATGAVYVVSAEAEDEEDEAIPGMGVALLSAALVAFIACARRGRTGRSMRRTALVGIVLLAIAAPASARTLSVTAVEDAHEYFFIIEGTDGRNPELRFEPGEELTFRVTNAGEQYHNFHVGPPMDDATDLLASGDTESITVTMPSDGDMVTQYWCEPHKELRMFGFIAIGDAEVPREDVPMPPTTWFLLSILVGTVVLRRPRKG